MSVDETTNTETPEDGVNAKYGRSFRWDIFLLGLLCPGGPYHLRGRSGLGAFLNILMVSFWVLYLIAWSFLKFAPLWPFMIVGATWLLISSMIAFDGAKLTRKEAEQVSEYPTSIVSTMALVVTTWVGPLLLLFLLANIVFWSFQRVEDESMYPTLLPGDLVLVDRRAYDVHGPSAGDVIAYHGDETSELQFGRIIAGPGESVSKLNGRWYVDGNQQVQRPVTRENSSHFIERAGSSPDAVNARWEHNNQKSYIIAGNPETMHEFNGKPQEWTVNENHIFVLHDNRSDRSDSRTTDEVEFSDIEGMVLYILDSNVNVASVSQARTGRTVQEPNRLIRRSASR